MFYVAIYGIDNPHAKTILAQANEMGQGFIKKDYNTLMKYTHPKVTRLTGGKDKMMRVLESQMNEAEKQGIQWKDVTFSEPSDLYAVGEELQCTIVQSLEMKIPTGRLIANATLIGFSENGGKDWVFVDPSQGLDKLRTVLPNISKKIQIPLKQKPQFFPE